MMQPTPPASLPRRPRPPPILTRGRSPAPKPYHHRSRSSSPSSPSSSSSSSSSLSSPSTTYRSDSPELMFPMSPVLSDEKQPFADDNNEIRYPYPIIVNLESAIPQRKMRLPTASLTGKENQNPNHHPHHRRSIVKPEPFILPTAHTTTPSPFPKLKPKTSASRLLRSGRLASFLHHPATSTGIPSVIESPTAVTVHRSGPSVEHVTTVSQPPSPSQPRMILSPPRTARREKEWSDIPEIEKAMMMRGKGPGGPNGVHFDDVLKRVSKVR